jgi:hypothetical protein
MKSLMILLAVLYASVCFGADSAVTINGTPFGEALSTLLTTTVFPILGAMALGFVSWAAKSFGSKFKIDALTADNNFVTNLAAQGVAFAEEKAANYAKQAQPLSNNDKLNAAIAYVMQMAPKVSPEQAQSLVTSALAMLPGVGATGNAAVGVPTIAPADVPLKVDVASDPLAVSP